MTSMPSATPAPSRRPEPETPSTYGVRQPWAGPALLLGGQLHNSTSSDLALTAQVMDRLVTMGANAVTATVSWHLIEPEEGRFCFDSVDALLDLARERDLALTLLWFGAYKNAASTYAPRWVRADTTRFPRAELSGAGTAAFSRPGTPVLSVFSEELVRADAAAFEALTRHLASVGAAWTQGGPLVMVQVENETGVLGAPRDRSAVAEAAWNAQVPAELLTWLGEHPQAEGTAARLWREHGSLTEGTWARVLGSDVWAEETFMAWGFAHYCEHLARIGREHLDVAYYANAWVGPQPGQDLPGQYPSGGPVAGQVDTWKAAAPSLVTLGPDLYVDDAVSAMAGYVRPDNPLLVPESRMRAGTALWAIGQGARGFNVFGIDDVRTDGQLAQAYALLGGMTDLLTQAQADGRVRGVLLEPGDDTELELAGVRWVVRAGTMLRSMFLDAGVQVRTEAAGVGEETTSDALVPTMTDTRAMGLLIELGEDEVLVLGQGLMLEPQGLDGGLVEIDDAVEGRFVDGQWLPGRNLNGDERLNLVPLDRLGVTRVRVLRLSA